MNDHWLVRGMGGVNIVTLIAIILGGAKLYFELDKDIALIKQNQASIERRLDNFSRTLVAMRSDLRERPVATPGYPGGYGGPYPQSWPTPATRSANPNREER